MGLVEIYVFMFIFSFSKAEPKGTDCYEAFSKMQDCMSQYPSLYAREINSEEEEQSLDTLISEEETTSAGKSESNSDKTSVEDTSSS